MINTTSASGIYGNVGQTNYGAAKAGIAAFTVIAAMELGRYGVTVNAVAPAALTCLTEGLNERSVIMKLLRVTCCLFVLLLSLIVFAFVPRSQASAASGLVTKDDVEAILHAGSILFFHGKPVPPFVENFPRAAITPLSFHSGTHYCVDDWHVVRITFVNVVDNVFFFTKEQAIADLEATTVTLTLDGVTLPAIRTPINILNAADQQRFGFPGPAFAFQIGSILSPAALSVGDHTAGIVATDPVFGTFQDSSTLTVDPSGTGVCLQG